MPQVFILNPPNIFRPNLSLKWKLSLRIFRVILFISIISLLIFYIFQVNSLTSENCLLKDKERKLAEIKKEKEILEINFSQAHSLANIESYFQNHDFEKANQVKYIQILGASVAAKSELLKE